MDTTPPTLLERLRHPTDQEAWHSFVKLYTPLLLQWARQQGLGGTDAADLVQDVFLVLVQKMPEFQYDRTKRFRSWLYTILINKWRDYQRRRRALPGAAVDLNNIAGPVGEFLDEAQYRQQLLAGAVELVKGDFHVLTWTAFFEHAVRGKAGPQVARELGLSLSAVYSAKFRVLQRLRHELRGLLD